MWSFDDRHENETCGKSCSIQLNQGEESHISRDRDDIGWILRYQLDVRLLMTFLNGEVCEDSEQQLTSQTPSGAGSLQFCFKEYFQSITVRVEGIRLRRWDAEQWMSHRMLPDNLRERIRRYEQYKWQQTRGVDEDYLISDLLKDLRRDVPMFEKMDEQLLDALSNHLKPALFTENSFIIRESDPVNEIFFLMRDPNASLTLPASTRTVQAVIDVEAFALTSNDLIFVAAQFRRLHSKYLRHTFRFYSQHWRTWAACFIQAAWHRHCRNKLEKSLREDEDILQDALTNEIATLPNLGATIYASKFAANALRALRRNHPRHLVCKEKDLLTIANVADQHEVWDFLSVFTKVHIP
ncbi:Cyclic nucleotide-gated ion channel 1 [Capsicum baccatum]|uniref:Cyclic nucleotide-gated ion channel 1 n=1 Tax=Capsicum baccatum TaxID=33114 RepID=A0A2G2WX03_CAPBA|nr:Cyclic nucleotide-gated ion channel 1 [Capsicum baccatum]